MDIDNKQAYEPRSFISNEERDRAVNEKKREDLTSSLNNSSVHIRNIMTGFLALIVYLLIATASTTDLQLLLPNAPVSLPLVNVKVNMFGFFILAPAFIVVMHFYLLVNLRHHLLRVIELKELKGDVSLISQSVFNFNFDENKPIIFLLLHGAQWLIIFFAPTTIILYIQIRFADYHHELVSWVHFAILIIDILLVAVFWTRLNKATWESVSTAKITWNDLFSKKWIRHTDRSILKKLLQALRLFQYFYIQRIFTGLVVVFSLTISVLVSMICSFNVPSFIPTSYIPKLTVTNTTIVDTPPTDAIIQGYIVLKEFSAKAAIDSAYSRHSTGVDLSYRELSYAVLDGCKMWNANFSNSILVGTSMKSSTLQNGVFFRTNMANANISESNLRGADIDSAYLVGVNLSAIIADDANIRYSNLMQSNAQGSKLNFSNLSHSNISGANFAESSFYKSNMTGLIAVRCNMKFTNFRRSVLLNAQFDSTDLTWSFLDTSNISHCSFRHSMLERASLDSCNLSDAKFNSSIIFNASIRCSNALRASFIKADLSYSVFDSTDFTLASLDSIEALGARFRNCLFFWSNFRYANFEHDQNIHENEDRNVFQGSYMESCDLTYAIFNGSIITQTYIKNTQGYPCTASFKGILGDDSKALVKLKRKEWECVELGPYSH